MCIRDRFSTFAEIAERFRIKVPSFELEKHFNAAPSQMLPVIIEEHGERIIKLMRWGLTPPWADSLAYGNKLINARAETLQEKPSFRKLIKSHRTIVPVNGFYEWMPTGKGKQPMYITLKSEEIIALAGLWDTWKSQHGEVVDTFTIITTDANELVAPIHNRMPVIIPNKDVDMWLSDDMTLIEHLKMLKPYTSSEMEYKPVSKLVSNASIDVPELLDKNFTGEIVAKPNSMNSLFE